MAADATPDPVSEFLARAQRLGADRVARIHRLAKRVWGEKRRTPAELQAECGEAWDRVGAELGTRVRALVPAEEDRPVANLIFGSGGFTTGAHQAAQFREVAGYARKPPVVLQGLVANRSAANGCRAAEVSRRFGVPLVEMDFADWYREEVDGKEPNPIPATRFWFPRDDPKRPPPDELARRFDVRQNRFHGALGERIAETVSGPTDIASARGYSFALSSAPFRRQPRAPHANDTHPADLTFVDPATNAKVYPGWQAGPIGRMMKDGHRTLRGSLIEVEFMDRLAQVDELDAGALLAVGGGVTPEGPMAAKDVQAAMKLVDDEVFCTLEPTGLILAWGITERPVPVEFRDLGGNAVSLAQRVVVVGDAVRGGVNAWGRDLERDLEGLERFLLQA